MHGTERRAGKMADGRYGEKVALLGSKEVKALTR